MGCSLRTKRTGKIKSIKTINFGRGATVTTLVLLRHGESIGKKGMTTSSVNRMARLEEMRELEMHKFLLTKPKLHD